MPNDKLIYDWQMIMSGLKLGAEKIKDWNVTLLPDKHIAINNDWKVICHFINDDYVEAKVFFKGDEYLAARHIKSYATTVNILLNYIRLNSA